MRRLLGYLTILFFILGIILPFALSLVPGFANVFEPIFCPSEEETLYLDEQMVYSGRINIQFQCVDEAGNRRDAGPIFAVFAFAWCWMPLLPLIGLIALSPTPEKPVEGSELSGGFVTMPQSTSSARMPANIDLTTRLAELKKAFDAGLITQAEYDQSRQDLLDKYTG